MIALARRRRWCRRRTPVVAVRLVQRYGGPVELERPARGAARVGERTTLEELERVIATLPESTWRDAAALAEEVELMGSFAWGLRLVPTGVSGGQRQRIALAR